MNFDIESDEDRERSRRKNNNNKLIYLALFFLVLSIVLMIVYAASNKRTTTKPTSTQPTIKKVEPTPIETVEPEKTEIEIIDENSDERPLAIMIDNNIGDAKHAGLQDSYINYEMIVEGGLTRTMALFKDKEVTVVGPVRSARDYFVDYALEHDAVYAHFGWSEYAEQAIKDLKVDNINGMKETEPYARDRNLPSPHNVFTSTVKLRDYFSKMKYEETSSDWKVFQYSLEEVDLHSGVSNQVKKADKVSMDYSYYENRSYTYDSENKYYLRSVNGNPHIDRRSDSQLHYKNIIIMKVENKTIDDQGRQKLTTTGTGKGYYITDGYAVPITWEKEERNSKTKYKYNSGEEITLNDGNTFIQIVPIKSNITID